jgi:hypothetical protein
MHDPLTLHVPGNLQATKAVRISEILMYFGKSLQDC